MEAVGLGQVSHAHVHSFMPAFIHSFMPAFIHSFMPTFIHAYWAPSMCHTPAVGAEATMRSTRYQSLFFLELAVWWRREINPMVA